MWISRLVVYGNLVHATFQLDYRFAQKRKLNFGLELFALEI